MLVVWQGRDAFDLLVAVDDGGWGGSVVGVLPVMAVLACFLAGGRCADNGRQDVV